MKILLFILLASLQLTVASYAQKNITLDIRNGALSTILNSIQQQTGYHFIYSNDEVPVRTIVSICATNEKLDSVLERLLKPYQLEFTLRNDRIVIRTAGAQQQEISTSEKSVSGKVIDESGIPMQGVSVQLKGTNRGTTTDREGHYQLSVPGGNAVLIFTFSEHVMQEVKVEQMGIIDVTMIAANNPMDEVVVIGYGTKKKVNLTGAVSTVNTERVIGDRPVTSTAQLLQGSVAGFQVTTGSGQPGANSSLNIRGITSINGGEPLVLVDNVPMDMNDINPRDIATISVLKDASASAIYGARAAFGVVLITTKNGKRNQPLKFEYSTNLSTTSATTLPTKASPLEYVTAMKDFGNTISWTGQNLDTWLSLLGKYNADPGAYPLGMDTVGGVTYFLKENNHYTDFFKPSFEQLHNLSVSGGSEKTAFRLSVGYANENGIVVSDADQYTRFNVNSSITTTLSSQLNFTANILYKNDVRYTPWSYGGLFNRIIQGGSFAPQGYGSLSDGTVLPYATAYNLVTTEKPSKDFGDNLRMFGKLEYTPFKGLKINGEYTFNRITDNTQQALLRDRYINISTLNPEYSNDISQYNRSNSLSNYHALNVYANYTTSINNVHNFSAVLGTNQENSSAQSFNISRLDLITSTVPSISTAAGTISGNDAFTDFKVSGYFGRLNYDYKNRYLFETSGRYDGSSRFPAGRRFGFFPSFSAGWILTGENFMKRLTHIVNLVKFRASYGEIGNQAIGSYAYIPSIAVSNQGPWINPVTNLRSLNLTPPGLVSRDFTWERVQTLNLGVDLSLFENKLTTTFDVFRRRTLDMLAPGLELPAIVGTAAPLKNVADLKSTGWELEINWKDYTHSVKYSVGFVLSDNQGYITRFKNTPGLLGLSNGEPTQYFIGQRIGDIWGYTTQGYFTANDFQEGSLNTNLMNGKLKQGIAPFRGIAQNPGDIRYVDKNGDSLISVGNGTLSDHGDLSIIGNNNRRFQFGINGSISYKNIDVSFFASGVAKRDLWLSNNTVYFPYVDQFANLFKDNLNYWTPNNPNGFFPRSYPAASGNTGVSRNVQTKYLVNGAYLRMKNVTLGYSLPKKMMNNISVSNAKIFFSGENLFTLSHMPEGIDPDGSNLAGRGGMYPQIRKYSFGVSLTF